MSYGSGGKYSPYSDVDQEDEIEPVLRGFQLIGDSQFLRFSEQLLGKTRKKKNQYAYLGLCVSGQKASDLFHRLKAKFHPTGQKAVLMIGTNDLLKKTPISELLSCLDNLVLTLIERGVGKLIILTIPPVLRLASSSHHWNTLNKYNEHIRSLHNGTDIYVVDAYPYFIKKGNLSQNSLSLSRSSLSSSRGSLVSNSSGISSPLPRSSISLHFARIPYTSNLGKIRTNLRIQLGEEKREIYVMDSDSEDEKGSQDSSYSSANTTPNLKRSSTFSTPNPKRRSHGSFLSPADDDHDDPSFNESVNDSEFDKINKKYFERYFGNNTNREDNIHLNYDGLRLLRRLIIDEIEA